LSVVLDSSATLAWIHGDERTVAIEARFERIVEEGAIVPGIWHLEIANSLTVAVRRNRITAEFRDAVLADLTQIGIATDPDTNKNAWSATLRLADVYKLTLYDAAYLELAQRRQLPSRRSMRRL
jgi:predicted nucleic acid-binding protein